MVRFLKLGKHTLAKPFANKAKAQQFANKVRKMGYKNVKQFKINGVHMVKGSSKTRR